MAPAPAPKDVSEPFAISCIAGRYLLFDVDIISHIRRNHNICGVLVGTIPNLSQQNVFLGIPLELMPEEARVLVEGEHAYIVDDVETHRQGFQEMSRADRLKYLAEIDRQGVEAANESLAVQERKKDVALKRKGLRNEVLESDKTPCVANSTATVESTMTPHSMADSTASDAAAHVELLSTAGSGLGFIMKGSRFLEQQPSVNTSVPSDSTSTVASDLGSLFIDLGFIMKGSSFVDSVEVKPQGVGQSVSDATASSSHTSDLDSSFSDLGSIMKGSSFLNYAPLEMRVKKPEAEEATHLLVKEVKPAETQLEEVVLKEFGTQAVEDPQEVALSSTKAKPEPAEDLQEVNLSTTEISLFDNPATSVPAIKSTSKSVFSQRQYITPTKSTPPLPTPPKDESRPLPVVPKSYPLFRFLHSRGYFFMPGLRFGCNYSVYPGDPLRYHSHFLATGLGWDEKFDLLDIVGGGRLGTGTKKAYMVGGQDPKTVRGDGKDPVRAFSVEWASM